MKRALDDAVVPTERARAAEARLKAQAQSWEAPTEIASIPLATEADIPVLDLGPYFESDSVCELERAAATLRQAKESTGFHFIVNHGVPSQLITRTFSMCQAFHALPVEAKQTLAMDATPSAPSEVRAGCGYLGYANAKLPARAKPNYNAAFIVKREVGPRNIGLEQMPWPDEGRHRLEGFRETVEAYCHALEALAKRMLPVYAVALGLRPHHFDDAFVAPLYRLRLSQYLPTPPGEYGINPHVDTSFFTILRSTGSGLVVQSAASRGGWVRAPMCQQGDAFLVNFGELLSQITNDTWPATRHYVLHARLREATAYADDQDNEQSQPRMALPFFFNATPTHRMAVLPTCCDAEHPPKYPPLSYLEGQGVVQGE